jgi:hypothetical protein
MLEDQQKIFIYGMGTLRLMKVLSSTAHWAVYQCHDEQHHVAPLTILIPRRWVAKTHWELVKVHFDAIWHAIKASYQSVWV